MSYTRKTKDEWWLLGNWGYGDGWEYLFAEDTLRAAKEQLKTYRENDKTGEFKIVKRRVPINKEGQ